MPRVTVIVPCRNEQRTIGLLLQAIHDQTWARHDMEVIVSDGMSTDGTRQAVADFAASHPHLAVRVVDNLDRNIPAALNRAVAAARGEVIIRLDAHSVPRPDYVERCVRALESTGAANVGGVWEIRPSQDTWIARAIADAAGHRLGAGDARYRTSGAAGETDTVPFGAFRREWLERVGPFNERLLTNEDYEFNVRLRQAGGRIWHDPAIVSTYFARGDLFSLARQYARYGYWKAQMLRMFPESLRWRQALPPAFVLALMVLLPFSLIWGPARVLLAIQLAGYGAVTVAAGVVQAVRSRDPLRAIGFPLALWTMHLAWGGAVLWGMVHNPIRGEGRSSGK
jgi:glycosyltransferase involved in cell wall biosynthesis